MKHESVPQVDDISYRDYLLKVVDEAVTKVRFPGGDGEFTPRRSEQEIRELTLKHLQETLKQDFSTTDNKVVTPLSVFLEVVDRFLAEYTGNSILRTIRYENLINNRQMSDRQILDLMFAAPHHEIWHFLGISKDILSKKCHFDLSRPRLENTTHVRENIYALQSYLRDSLQNEVIYEGSPETFRPQFFLYKEEWRNDQRRKALFPVKPSFASRSALNEEFLFSKADSITGYTLKQGLFASSEDRERATSLIVSTINIKDYSLVLKSLENVEDLPTEGIASRVIVAKIGGSYHVRIFGKTGNILIDRVKGGFLPDSILVQKLDAALSNQIDKQAEIELIREIISSLGYTPIELQFSSENRIREIVEGFLKIDSLLRDGHQNYLLQEYKLAKNSYDQVPQIVHSIAEKLAVSVLNISDWETNLGAVGLGYQWQPSLSKPNSFIESLDPSNLHKVIKYCEIKPDSPLMNWNPVPQINGGAIRPTLHSPSPKYVDDPDLSSSNVYLTLGPFNSYKLCASGSQGIIKNPDFYRRDPIDTIPWNALKVDYPANKRIPQKLLHNYSDSVFSAFRKHYFGRAFQKVNADNIQSLIDRNVVKVPDYDGNQTDNVRGALLELNNDLLSLIPHIYFFVLPLCQGDIAAAKGDFPTAANYYAQILREPLLRGSQKTSTRFVNPNSEADGHLPWGYKAPDWSPLKTDPEYPFNGQNYPYLNQDIEVPLLRARLANLYLNWAESLYRTDRLANVYRARELYKAVMRLYDLDPLSQEHLSSLPIKIALRTHNGKHLAAEGGGGGALNANRDWIREWETFELINLGELEAEAENKTTVYKVALRTHNSRYICAEDHGQHKLVANHNSIQDWSTFELIRPDDKDDKQIALRAHNGKYVAAENGGGSILNANRERRNIWETFELVYVYPFITAQQMRARNSFIRISRDLNFYGYSYDFVPHKRDQILLKNAKENADLAREAGRDFLNFKKAADDDRIEILKTWKDKVVAGGQVKIAKYRHRQAENNLEQAKFQLELVRNSIKAKESEIADGNSFCGQAKDYVSGMKSFFSMSDSITGGRSSAALKADFEAAKSSALSASSSAAAIGGIGITGGMALYAVGTSITLSGMADAANRRLDELEQLREQERLAEASVNNWEREITITELQEQAATLESEVTETIINRLLNRGMNAEYQTHLADVGQTLAQAYLDDATEYAWLARQALRYRLGCEDEELEPIKFSYLSPGKEIFEDAQKLRRELAKLDDPSRELSRPEERSFTISLARDFPLEFNQLKTQGYCQFVTNSDFLRQAWPKNYSFRIRTVHVTTQNVKVAGDLYNSGISSVERETVGEWMTLLGPRTQKGFPKAPTEDGSPVDSKWLNPAEGSGLDTLWELGIPRSRNGDALDALTDVYISFNLWAKASNDREVKLKAEWAQHGLPTRTHTVLFSAKQHFPQSFAAFSANNEQDSHLEFKLTEDDFFKSEKKRQVTNVAVFFLGEHLNREVKGTLSSESLPEGAHFHTVDQLAHSNRIPEPASEKLRLPASPLDSLASVSPVQTWRIKVPDAPTRRAIGDVLLGIEYTTQIGF